MPTIPAAPTTSAAPDARAAHYRELGWWRPELLNELVLRHAERLADRIAVVAGQRRVTYRDLAGSVRACAARLRGLGLQPEDRVVLQLPNGLDLLVLALGLMRARCVPVLVLPTFREHELGHLLATLRPVAMAVAHHSYRFDHLALVRKLRADHDCLQWTIVVDPVPGALDGDAGELDTQTLYQAAGPVGPRAKPWDTALLMLSSGTTGQAKAIPRSHEALASVMRHSAAVSAFGEDTVFLAQLPATHSFTFAHPGILGTLAHGGRVVFGAGQDPRTAFGLIELEGVTHTALVPTVAEQWVRHRLSDPRDLSSLRVLQVGGARLGPEPATAVERGLGCRVQQVYGMSEGFLAFTRLDDPDDVVRHTQGRPIAPGDEVRIVDAAGRPVTPGATGELWTRGPSTIPGYLAPPEVNRAVFGDDGFYRTGDLVRMSESGNLIVVGRVKDVINRAGEKIAADDIEDALRAHPEVAAAAVVAMPHPDYGEAVCAVVVGRNAAAPSLRSVRTLLEQRGFARYKLPERVELVDTLPLTGVGKVDKVRLRRTVADRLAAERG
ncbi:MAG: (2,3-dihydroxybenzoyl)adenylate synthase [Pseudonocardiaceae bacterium]